MYSYASMCCTIATSVTINYSRNVWQGEFSEFGKPSAIQLDNLKPSKLVVRINS